MNSQPALELTHVMEMRILLASSHLHTYSFTCRHFTSSEKKKKNAECAPIDLLNFSNKISQSISTIRGMAVIIELTYGLDKNVN